MSVAELGAREFLWERFVEAARDAPSSIAVHEQASGRAVPYGVLHAYVDDLVRSLEPQRARGKTHLVHLGGAGAAETALVLAGLRLGLALVPVSWDAPPEATLAEAHRLGDTLVVGSAARLRAWGAAVSEARALVLPRLGARTGPGAATAGQRESDVPWLVQQRLAAPGSSRSYSADDVLVMRAALPGVADPCVVARVSPPAEPHALLETTTALGGGRLVIPPPGPMTVDGLQRLVEDGVRLLVLTAQELADAVNFRPSLLQEAVTVVIRDRKLDAAVRQRVLARLPHIRVVRVAAPGGEEAFLGPRVVTVGGEPVDLDLVERSARRLGGTQAVTVSATRDSLVATVPAGESGVDVEQLKRALQQELPVLAVPRRWRVEATPSQAAPRAARAPQVPLGRKDPESRAELRRELGRTWCEVLGRQDLPEQADFLDLGGTSREAVALRRRLRALHPEVPITLRRVYELPGFEQMLDYLATHATTRSG